MIVVDTTILAYLFLPGSFARQAEALLYEDADWATPPLWRSEFRNVLAGYLRRGALDLQAAVATLRDVEALLDPANLLSILRRLWNWSKTAITRPSIASSLHLRTTWA